LTNSQCFDEFDIAYHNLISAYDKLNPTERPSKIRKLQDNKEYPELLELFDNQNGSITQNSCSQLDVCTCSTCPARKELEQLNNFYMEFLQQ